MELSAYWSNWLAKYDIIHDLTQRGWQFTRIVEWQSSIMQQQVSNGRICLLICIIIGIILAHKICKFNRVAGQQFHNGICCTDYLGYRSDIILSLVSHLNVMYLIRVG